METLHGFQYRVGEITYIENVPGFCECGCRERVRRFAIIGGEKYIIEGNDCCIDRVIEKLERGSNRMPIPTASFVTESICCKECYSRVLKALEKSFTFDILYADRTESFVISGHADSLYSGMMMGALLHGEDADTPGGFFKELPCHPVKITLLGNYSGVSGTPGYCVIQINPDGQHKKLVIEGEI